MNEKNPGNKAKRGRKPLDDAPMTPAERQRRRRELLRAEGGKNYLLHLNTLQQGLVEILAKSNGVSETKVLQVLIEVSLDRDFRVMERCLQLKHRGATDAEVAEFMQTHFLPRLPSIDELELPRPENNQGTDNIAGVSASR